MPFLRNQQRLLGRALGGFQVAGYINPDNGNAPANPANAMFIGVSAYSNRTGNLGRNTIRTPGIENTDANVQKTVRVAERVSLQFRAEFLSR